MQIFCLSGYDPNQATFFGNSSLHSAAHNGQFEVIQLLLSHRAYIRFVLLLNFPLNNKYWLMLSCAFETMPDACFPLWSSNCSVWIKRTRSNAVDRLGRTTYEVQHTLQLELRPNVLDFTFTCGYVGV